MLLVLVQVLLEDPTVGETGNWHDDVWSRHVSWLDQLWPRDVFKAHLPDALEWPLDHAVVGLEKIGASLHRLVVGSNV